MSSVQPQRRANPDVKIIISSNFGPYYKQVGWDQDDDTPIFVSNSLTPVLLLLGKILEQIEKGELRGRMEKIISEISEEGIELDLKRLGEYTQTLHLSKELEEKIYNIFQGLGLNISKEDLKKVENIKKALDIIFEYLNLKELYVITGRFKVPYAVKVGDRRVVFLPVSYAKNIEGRKDVYTVLIPMNKKINPKLTNPNYKELIDKLDELYGLLPESPSELGIQEAKDRGLFEKINRLIKEIDQLRKKL